jgi:hypothetical protein
MRQAKIARPISLLAAENGSATAAVDLAMNADNAMDGKREESMLPWKRYNGG